MKTNKGYQGVVVYFYVSEVGKRIDYSESVKSEFEVAAFTTRS